MDIKKFKDSNIFKSNNRRDRKNEYHSKINELEELEKSLNFVAIETRFWRWPNSVKEELKRRKITRKKINEIKRLEREINEMKELKERGKKIKVLN